MSVGINDNISKIYQAQQTVRQTTSNQTAVANSFSAQNKKSEKLKKIGIGVCAALGVAASLAVLAKFDKSKSYTINPLKMFRGKLKDSYIFSTEYKTKEIVTIGSGSIIGGLIGGTAPTTYQSHGGAGGTQSAGGAGGRSTGSYPLQGHDGRKGYGGAGGYNSSSDPYGGCGGAGWYGGGGGSMQSYYTYNNAGGGGGSSYTDSSLCSDVVHTQGFNDGNGYIILTEVG